MLYSEFEQIYKELSKQLSIVGDLIEKIHPLAISYTIKFDQKDSTFKLNVDNVEYSYLMEDEIMIRRWLKCLNIWRMGLINLAKPLENG